METKICSKCKCLKPLDLFYPKPQGKVGVISRCKQCILSIQKNDPNAKKNKKLYDIKHKDKKNKARREKYHSDIELSRQKNKEKREKNLERYRELNRKSKRKRYQERKSDPLYKIQKILRGRFLRAVTKQYKNSSAIDLIGISLNGFKLYIESKFQDGMTWENHGLKGWHIDHIKPCTSFDLTNPEQQKICFHYTNLQPLWWTDNLKKGIS